MTNASLQEQQTHLSNDPLLVYFLRDASQEVDEFVEQHLERCSKCQAKVDALRRVVSESSTR